MKQLIERGLWLERLSGQGFSRRPALFLDRDGVIVEEVNYLNRIADIAVIEATAAGIAATNRAGVPVIMVTNQAGIGRGYFDWKAFAAVQAEILDRLAGLGAHVDLVLACAYHEKGQDDYRVADHIWRKPNPGMFLKAQSELDIDLARSLVVGDKISDLAAGRNAGLRRGVLVLSGHGRDEVTRFEPKAAAGTAAGFEVEIAETAAETISDWLEKTVGVSAGP